MHTFQEDLNKLESELDYREQHYISLMNALLRLRIPSAPTQEDLARLYTVCFRIMGAPNTGRPLALAPNDARNRNELARTAEELLKATIFDVPGASRASLGRRRAVALTRCRGEDRPLHHRHLPSVVRCPWPRGVAEHQIEPYLNFLEAQLPQNPARHLELAWSVYRHGFSPFREIIGAWVARCDARRLGLGGAAAVPLASQLLDEAHYYETRIENGHALPDQRSVDARLRPLLRHPHRFVVAHAARAFGTWYAGTPPTARPALSTVLETIRTLPTANASAAGGFLAGFDEECTGLATLCDGLPDTFDVDTFAIDLLARDKEPELPAIPAFWYYVQEYYDHSPGFIHRLIDRGLADVALMCATEWPAPVVGMDDVLHRLASQSDQDIASRAFDHLAAIYSGHMTQH